MSDEPIIAGSCGPDPHSVLALPYKIAVLCYLYDADERLLLLHRVKNPNAGFYSPIGGKLEASIGEGPHQCAVREIHEESGVIVADEDVRLCGVVTERAYEGETHWLIFLFEVTRRVDPAEIAAYEIEEGKLEWIPTSDVAGLNIPETDRDIMWPLIQSHRGGFFMVHIDCGVAPISWKVVEAVPRCGEPR